MASKKNKNLMMNLSYELKCLDGSQAPSEVTKYVKVSPFKSQAPIQLQNQ
jgi:hypothetical protein